MSPISLHSLLWATLSFSGLTYASASSGCGHSLPSSQSPSNSYNSTLTLTDGTTRTYRIFIPKTYSSTIPAPLILNYHGRGSNGAEQEKITGMSRDKWNNASIIIYPDGLNAEWQGDPSASSDDITFTTQLVSSVSSTYCVDPSRIYAVGSSNGGGFVANYLACSDWGSSNIAAFGAAFGAFYTNSSSNHCDNAKRGYSPFTVPIACNSTRQDVPMIEFHGTGDDTIPYNGGERRGFCLPAIPHFVTEWANRVGLGTSNTSTSLYNGQSNKFEFGDGDNKGLVTHYEIDGTKHEWPTTEGNVAPFNATPVLMEFLSQWGPGDGKGFDAATASSAASTTGKGGAKSTNTVTASSAAASTTGAKSSGASIGREAGFLGPVVIVVLAYLFDLA